MLYYLFVASLISRVVRSCPTVCSCGTDHVSCSNAGVDSLPSDIPSNTKTLILSKNRLSTLTRDTFSRFHNLTHLYIDQNRIKTVDKNAFSQNYLLQTLNLSNNVISILPDGVFSNNRHLINLDLRNNIALPGLPYESVEHIETLKTVKMNNVDCTSCAMSTWYEYSDFFNRQDIEVEINCFYPSESRGKDLFSLNGEEMFSGCNKCPELTCASGQCYKFIEHCDTNYDCYDKTDENECLFITSPTSEVAACKESELSCDNGRCSALTWSCDGYDDCGDGSDEINCEGTDSGNKSDCSEFTCSNGRCVDHVVKCNGVNDCGDWTDESKLMCGDSAVGHICAPGLLPCGVEGHCIEHHKLCDGIPDCIDGTDEGNCAGNCSSGSTSCGARCIPDSWLCDGVADCTDKSDEQNCSYQCGGEQFKCGSGCLSCSLVCDGYNDCPNGLDELNCSICNSTTCLDSPETCSNLTTVIIIATSISGCVSVISVLLIFTVFRHCHKKHRGMNQEIQRLPPAYSEIATSSPPPRYKSEPDIPHRLVNVCTDTPQTESLTSV